MYNMSKRHVQSCIKAAVTVSGYPQRELKQMQRVTEELGWQIGFILEIVHTGTGNELPAKANLDHNGQVRQ